MDYEKRIAELFLELPDVSQSVKAVVPYIAVGKLLYVSGQLPLANGKLSFKGRLGLEVSLDQGMLAARHALLNVLSIVRQASGSLNKVQKIVQLSGFVACGADFKDQERVLDAASSLLQDVFGPHGKHARIAVGVNTLPQGACVELAMIAEIKN